MSYITRNDVLKTIENCVDYSNYVKGDEKYELFIKNKDRLIFILTKQENIIPFIDVLKEFTNSFNYPDVITNIMYDFLDPILVYSNEYNIDNEQLVDIVFKLPVLEKSRKLIKEPTEVSSSKIKNKKDPNKKRDNTEFDVFNTF